MDRSNIEFNLMPLNRAAFTIISVLQLLLTTNCIAKLDKVDCRAIECCLLNPQLREHFQIHHLDTLVVINKIAAVEDSCKFTSMNLHVTMRWPNDLQISKGASKEHKNEVVLFKCDVAKNTFRLHFWKPYGNVVATVEVRKHKTNYSTKLVSSGVF